LVVIRVSDHPLFRLTHISPEYVLNMKKTTNGLLILILTLVFTNINILSAQNADVLSWGDQGNGTYKNPILNGDYSDPDVIRVNDDFYMISSTFHMSPGVIILHSNDLVNWTIIGHAFADLSQFNDEYGPEKMGEYSHGVWAPAIRYHDGKFWVYVFDPSFGLFMTTATNPAGPWEPATLVMKAVNHDDCCPFWDDDGQMYLTGARYPPWVDDQPRTYDILLWKLSYDGKSVLDSGTIIHRGHGSEATKILKINGWYYIFYCEHQDGEFKNDRMQMAMRSKNLYGPYEHHRLIQQRKEEDRTPGQGGLVDAKDGSWWFIHQQGNSNYLGRQAVLEPVTWIDGWPIIGKVMHDGVGSMVWEYEKPLQGYPVAHPQSTDEFSSLSLMPQWEWNHAPRNTKWSLTERNGFLRLHASMPSHHGFWGASNTLAQRCMGTESAYATTLLNVEGMADGQEAGLCIMGGNVWMLQVYQENGNRILRTKAGGKQEDFMIVANQDIGQEIWMRVLTNGDNFCFQYSLNGITFLEIGSSFKPYFLNWRAVQVGLFSFNEKENAGYIDVDWFKYVYR